MAAEPARRLFAHDPNYPDRPWAEAHHRADYALNTRLDHGGDEWIGGWALGAGGMGSAGVWLRQDENHNVVSRIVAKETWLGTRSWGAMESWAGDVTNLATRRPMEHHITEKMATRTDNSVQYLGGSVDRRRMSHRTLLELCGHGTLDDIINIYASHLPRQIERNGNRHIPEGTENIPEPFLWYVFDSLAKAVAAMAGDRVVDRERMARCDVKEVVHRDIKPQNVFFRKPDDNYFPAYPVPVLGDYGLAIETDRHDRFNPELYRDSGTPGFFAAEQKRYVHTAGLLPAGPSLNRLGAKTNVWAIGMTMIALINLDRGPEQVDYSTPQRPEIEQPTHVSDELQDLVNTCVAFSPAGRPIPRVLLRRIRAAMPRHDRGMAAQNPAPRRGARYPNRLYYPIDRFPAHKPVPANPLRQPFATHWD
ncbi:hypothetical protein LTR66_003951 [Elasticomyces elasticus]|nr:hypothetical protein LTR66_003951 [Elasticomyces elasticus]